MVEIYREGFTDPTASGKTIYYDVEVDSYYSMGMTYMTLTHAEFEDIQAWQDETGIQVVYPAITDAPADRRQHLV